jgi:serine/threonine protein kinase
MMNEGPAVGATWQAEYLLQAALGDPAHGVFRAQRIKDSQTLALRVWRAPNDPLAREFLEHASAASAVRHSAIAQVEAAGREELICWVASEYIVGQKLDTWADQVGIPPLGEVIELMRRLCEGLALAARGGVTHSALHPRNLVMVQGDPTSSRRAQPKLLDLGVPQLARPRQPHALAAQFMAPEQLAVVLEPSQPPLPHATSVMNVYSCGALLYYLCTGGPPHRQLDPVSLREAQLTGKLVVPSRINPQITPSLNAVMMQALAIDPTARYATVSDLGEALTHVSLTPSVANARPVLSMNPPRGSFAPPIPSGPSRASAIGRSRVSSPPPAISVPAGIARRPPPAAAEFEPEHETARTGPIPITNRPLGAWVSPPEPAGPTAPPPPMMRDLASSPPAGSFSSQPPPPNRASPVPKAPEAVLAAPVALFSAKPSEKSQVQVAPIRVVEPPPDSIVLDNDSDTTRPPPDRQRSPMLWFGVLAAVACAALFGLVRLLGNPSPASDEQTPTVTVDRPAVETSPSASRDVPRVPPAVDRIAPPPEPTAPPPPLPEPSEEPVFAPSEPEAREPPAANTRGTRSAPSRPARTPPPGAVASNREARAPGVPPQTARDAQADNEPSPVRTADIPSASPSAMPSEPLATPEPAQQSSKAVSHGADAAAAPLAPSPPREEAKRPTSAPEPNLPLEAKSAIGEVAFRGPLPSSSVRRALERINPQLKACYARAAQAAGKNQFGSLTVELEIDERGRARNPSASGAKLAGLNECVAEAASRVISDRAPDTGTVHASFKVIFSP